MPIVTCPNCGTKNRVDERARQLKPVCGRCGAELPFSDTSGNGAASSEPITVTDASFSKDVLASGSTPVLLDCWAPWCGPCRMLAPTIDQLAAESNGRYVVAKLNVDENPNIANQFQIASIPALLIFKNGQLVERLAGLRPKQDLASRLAAHV